MSLTNEQVRKALKLFFPDLYDSKGKWVKEISLDKDVENIQHKHTSYGSNKPDFIEKDIQIIHAILEKHKIL